MFVRVQVPPRVQNPQLIAGFLVFGSFKFSFFTAFGRPACRPLRGTNSTGRGSNPVFRSFFMSSSSGGIGRHVGLKIQ